jgi:hypothetical protein
MLLYGTMSFRIVLAAGGFYIGYAIGQWIPGIASSNMQMLISLALGAGLAVAAFYLQKITLNLAGGLLGFVVGLFIVSMLNLPSGWLSWVIILASTILVGIFGDRLGDWILILASSIAGAYAVVGGMNLLFNGDTGATFYDMPRTLPVVAAFLLFAIIGILSQYQSMNLRRRLMRV